ncbi:hypothetical protein HHK36_020051 [Tetracentron sinense]|uniref:Uncharacterized protein n=1 Tax=Tetracentron sinense TaxID=13715 RepID=A0A835D811_TETSI|nr:hypothetical protein HHK36_020051 [Tetracentron sinense]
MATPASEYPLVRFNHPDIQGAVVLPFLSGKAHSLEFGMGGVGKLQGLECGINFKSSNGDCRVRHNLRGHIMLRAAVNLYMEIDRFSMSARFCKEIGELYELEQNIQQSIVFFECNVESTNVLVFFFRYPKAINIYEEIARKSLNNNLLKYGVKGHLLNAGLCQLCKGDVVAITNSLERYQELDPTFSGTREYKFLSDLAAAIEEDVTKFTDVVKEFDSMTTLVYSNTPADFDFKLESLA